MIDLATETRLTLGGASRFLCDGEGNAPSTCAITRWIYKGIRGVRLEHVRVGRRIYTSAEALNRFAAALAEVDRQRRDPAPAQRRRTSRTRHQRAIEAAEQACAAAGI